FAGDCLSRAVRCFSSAAIAAPGKLDYLQEVLEQWAKELGVQDLRASKDHSLVGEATAAAFLYLNETLALWPVTTLLKDLSAWADLQSSTFRVHCTYMVNEMVQQLKDILTALHEPEDTSESAEAPATGDGGEADAAEEAAAETSEGHLDGEANEDSGENENEGEMGDEPLAPGSTIDQMETLPFNGEVSEDHAPTMSTTVDTDHCEAVHSVVEEAACDPSNPDAADVEATADLP
ncbi:unnamed protein product, partial [Cladocopium goreaui]